MSRTKRTRLPESTIPEITLRNAIGRNGRFALQGQKGQRTSTLIGLSTTNNSKNALANVTHGSKHFYESISERLNPLQDHSRNAIANVTHGSKHLEEWISEGIKSSKQVQESIRPGVKGKTGSNQIGQSRITPTISAVDQ